MIIIFRKKNMEKIKVSDRFYFFNAALANFLDFADCKS